MKLSLLIPAALGSLSIGASATTSESQERYSTRVFWDYSTCVVRQSPSKVEELLKKRDWGQAECLAATRLAQRSGYACAPPGSRIQFSGQLFRGAMAAAAFVRHRRGQSLPDYRDKPPVYPFPTQQAALAAPSVVRATFLAFAGCVVRNQPNDVYRLLSAEPFSTDENAIWQQISPVLGACLPAQEGAQLRFSRIALRGLLGEAAYGEDSAAIANMKSSVGNSQ